MDGRDTRSLVETAKALLAPPKGILAVDETPRTLTTRFEALGIPSTEETRRDFRELLFRTEGIAGYISGAILNDETARQRAAGGTAIIEVLQQQGILAGVKVDRGIQPLPGAPGEGITEGLDGLRPRLEEYRQMGIAFTKWRALLAVGPGMPSRYCIETNAHTLARYAALALDVGLVPIVEAEVLIDGKHDIDRCHQATEETLAAVFAQLSLQRVPLDAVLLKPNMVVSGKDAAARAGSLEVAEKTIACLRRTVPVAVPGVAFLSGGQTDGEAIANLNAICVRAAETGVPWQVSFSFARALQSAPMRAWSGKPENVGTAQAVFRRRAHVTSAARQGTYRPDMDNEKHPLSGRG